MNVTEKYCLTTKPSI